MLDPLFKKISEETVVWKKKNYFHKDYPAISEILRFATLEDGSPRYLRHAQIIALETYWYLRLIENTPHIIDLYNKYYPDEIEFLEVLGIPTKSKKILQIMLKGKDKMLDILKDDQRLIKELKLEALHETLTLNYPSYILALAMGAGKTILIGSIIATEFACSLEYSKGPFIRNALVFAPGKTIIESLKQLSDIPFEKILHKKRRVP